MPGPRPTLRFDERAVLVQATGSTLAAVVTAAGGGGGGSLVGLLLPLLLLGAFFLFAVRPQRQRQRQFLATQSALAEGQEVLTTAGLYGTVAEIGTDFVLLEVAPGVRLKYAKAAIAKIFSVEEPIPGSTDIELPPEDRPQS